MSKIQSSTTISFFPNYLQEKPMENEQQLRQLIRECIVSFFENLALLEEAKTPNSENNGNVIQDEKELKD